MGTFFLFFGPSSCFGSFSRDFGPRAPPAQKQEERPKNKKTVPKNNKNGPLHNRNDAPKTRKASQNNKNAPRAEEEGPQKQEKPIKVIEELVVHRVAQSARAPYIYICSCCCTVVAVVAGIYMLLLRRCRCEASTSCASVKSHALHEICEKLGRHGQPSMEGLSRQSEGSPAPRREGY